jgi:hypothetical protein
MQLEAQPITRRRLFGWALAASALCGRIYAFASDFWNKKAPADWTSDEVHQLLTKSPWAKPVSAEAGHSSSNRPNTGSNTGNDSGISNPRMGSSGSGRGSGGLGGGGTSGMGMPRSTSGGGGGGGSARSVSQVKGIVRWESAKPIVEAAKSSIPAEFANHYVIAVINFPLGGKKSEDDDGQAKLSKSALARIQAASSLTPKGKTEAQPGVVQVVGGFLLLGFSKETMPLSLDDKEVAFATVVGKLNIKAKFTLKEMVYHDALAV